MRMALRVRAKDGRWVWPLINGRVTARDQNGRVLGFVGTRADNTELQASQQRERTLQQ